WNYCNELSVKVWERERRLLSGYDFHPFTKGAGKAGLGLHSGTIQAVAEEYATRRKQARKVKLRWRASRGSRRSLGWIPFKGNAIRYRNGQLFIGRPSRALRGGRRLRAGRTSTMEALATRSGGRAARPRKTRCPASGSRWPRAAS
ncbi:MAG: hypothetical protein WCE85_47385, partial [Paraburkholderia sp.]